MRHKHIILVVLVAPYFQPGLFSILEKSCCRYLTGSRLASQELRDGYLGWSVITPVVEAGIPPRHGNARLDMVAGDSHRHGDYTRKTPSMIGKNPIDGVDVLNTEDSVKRLTMWRPEQAGGLS